MSASLTQGCIVGTQVLESWTGLGPECALASPPDWKTEDHALYTTVSKTEPYLCSEMVVFVDTLHFGKKVLRAVSRAWNLPVWLLVQEAGAAPPQDGHACPVCLRFGARGCTEDQSCLLLSVTQS